MIRDREKDGGSGLMEIERSDEPTPEGIKNEENPVGNYMRELDECWPAFFKPVQQKK